MTRALPLPDPLRGRPFAVAQARSLGVSVSRLRASDLVMPTRGARAPVQEPAAIPLDEFPSTRMERLRHELFIVAESISPALSNEQFFSHETGLALIGAPLPYTRARAREIHVSARRPAAAPERAGVVGHRLQTREPARWRARGLPIEHPARLWRQAASRWELDDVIAAGDFLVLPQRKLLTLDDLWRELREAGDVRGSLLRRALEEIRPGAETAEETALRLALVRAGLPEPELNVNLFAPDGRFIARLDLAYRRYRLGVEHDGRTHAFDEKQFARDADRWDDIRSVGWDHVRILSHHLRPDLRPAVAKVTSALIAAGWSPGAD
ncbi:MAG: hypothetical protein QM611_02180 [Microbacterium sp.]|uniref:hypothetical protein n=1 Tax=Microbacterium sp. TaxID=51671 RepID=UPI0039E4A708